MSTPGTPPIPLLLRPARGAWEPGPVHALWDADLVGYLKRCRDHHSLVERNGTIGWELLQSLAKKLRGGENATDKPPPQ